MSGSKIETTIEKLRVLCQYQKPKIDYIFYFPWAKGPEYTCGYTKPSKRFRLMANIIRSKGKLVEPTRLHLERFQAEPMEIEDSAARHTGNHAKIHASVEQAIVQHAGTCNDCREKWKQLKIIKEPEIETWNDYVREVNALRAELDNAKFCISIDEHFPQKDDLLEFTSEYVARVEEIFHLFEFIGDESYYFVMEYWEQQDGKMTTWKACNREEDLPGGEFLNSEL